MAVYRAPKSKICRKENINILTLGNYTGAAAKAVQKKNYPPGAHGKKGTFSKQSEYGKQLREKQKAKRIFGLLEKQFKNYYLKAKKSKEDTGFGLLQLLERRLDNVIFKSGIAETRRQARQIVTHAHVTLNGKKVDIPSIITKVGDKFEIKETKKKSPLYADITKKKYTEPKWLKVELPQLKGEVIRDPNREDVEQIIESQLIVEYYSK